MVTIFLIYIYWDFFLKISQTLKELKTIYSNIINVSILNVKT